MCLRRYCHFKTRFTLQALSSLRKYPLILRSGKECRILEGFGPRLCDMLDEKLVNYARELGVTPSEALVLGNMFNSANSADLNKTGQVSERILNEI